MRFGVLATRKAKRSKDLSLIFNTARDKDIEPFYLDPSDVIIKAGNDGLKLLYLNNEPLQVDGIINWTPYPVLVDEISAACKYLDLPLINDAAAIRTAKNKMLTSIALCKHGFPQPESVYLQKQASRKGVLHLPLKLPVVYKPKNGSRGRGACKIDTSQSFRKILGKVSRNSDVYLQNYVANDGWDLRVAVVGKAVLGAVKRTSRPGEWRTHREHGGQVEPYPVDDRLNRLAAAVTSSLGLHFAGLDIILDQEKGYQVLEVNSVPGLTIFNNTTGINIAGAIFDHLSDMVNNGNSGDN